MWFIFGGMLKKPVGLHHRKYLNGTLTILQVQATNSNLGLQQIPKSNSVDLNHYYLPPSISWFIYD